MTEKQWDTTVFRFSKFRIVNMHKMPGYRIAVWYPMFIRYWHGQLWVLDWLGIELELDLRNDIWGDMILGEKNWKAK